MAWNSGPPVGIVTADMIANPEILDILRDYWSQPHPSKGPQHSEYIRGGLARAKAEYEAREHELLFVLPDGTEVHADTRERGWCEACGAEVFAKRYTGRPREYCSNACRQRAYRQRKAVAD
jgi:hypothetical protein